MRFEPGIRTSSAAEAKSWVWPVTSDYGQARDLDSRGAGTPNGPGRSALMRQKEIATCVGSDPSTRQPAKCDGA